MIANAGSAEIEWVRSLNPNPFKRPLPSLRPFMDDPENDRELRRIHLRECIKKLE